MNYPPFCHPKCQLALLSTGTAFVRVVQCGIIYQSLFTHSLFTHLC